MNHGHSEAQVFVRLLRATAHHCRVGVRPFGKLGWKCLKEALRRPTTCSEFHALSRATPVNAAVMDVVQPSEQTPERQSARGRNYGRYLFSSLQHQAIFIHWIIWDLVNRSPEWQSMAIKVCNDPSHPGCMELFMTRTVCVPVPLSASMSIHNLLVASFRTTVAS